MSGKTRSGPDENDARAQLELARLFLAAESHAASVTLTPGELALNIPVPAGCRALGTLRGQDDQLVRMLLESPRDPDEALEEYEARLRERGWTEESFGARSGFIPAPQQVLMLRYVSPSHDMALMITAMQRAGGGTILSLLVTDAPDIPQHDDRMRRHNLLQHTLPALRAPRDVTLQAEGASGSDTSWRTYARMTTDLEVAAVMAHFDQQLAQQPLTHVGGGSDTNAGWSLWSTAVDDLPMLVALLAIRIPDRPGAYLLEARVEASDHQDNGAGGTAYGRLIDRRGRRPQ